jgi:hypothetical protein
MNPSSSINDRAEQSRINGSKSKGPTSDAGKARSSHNALKHGFAAAHNNVLTIEEVPVFEQHVDGYIKSYNPKTYAERTLVEQLASISWRHARLVGLETSFIELQLSIQNKPIEQTYPQQDPDPSFHLVLAFQGLARQPQKPVDGEILPKLGHDVMSIELVRRYLVTLDRQYRNTLLNLRQYQKDFAANAITEQEDEPTPKAPAAQPNEPEPKPATAEIRPFIVVKPAPEPTIAPPKMPEENQN